MFRRRDPLALSFEQREGIFVPQTAGYWALHADVCLRAIATGEPVTLVDAHLDWLTGSGKKAEALKSLRWDRVAIDGHFRYPIEPLTLVAGPTPGIEVTFTFDAGLVKLPVGPPPSETLLRLRLAIGGREWTVDRDLWRVEIAAWDQPRAGMIWLSPPSG